MGTVTRTTAEATVGITVGITEDIMADIVADTIPTIRITDTVVIIQPITVRPFDRME
jgi:hypothetical protein